MSARFKVGDWAAHGRTIGRTYRVDYDYGLRWLCLEAEGTTIKVLASQCRRATPAEIVAAGGEK